MRGANDVSIFILTDTIFIYLTNFTTLKCNTNLKTHVVHYIFKWELNRAMIETYYNTYLFKRVKMIPYVFKI